MTKVYFSLREWQLAWYTIISLTGIIGNLLVIYLALTTTKNMKYDRRRRIDRKAPFNIYLVSLAFTDFLISLSCIPIYVLSTSAFDHPSGTAGEWICKIMTGYFLPFWMLDISAFLLVAIAIERRRAITDPFSRLKNHTIWKTVAIIIFVVILSLITQAPIIYGSHYAETEPNIGNSCVYFYDNLPMKIMHYNSFLLQTIIPSSIFFVCFWQIQNQLASRSSSLTRHLTAYKGTLVYKKKVKHVMKRTKETVNTMQLVVIAFLVCVVVNQVFFMTLEPVLRVTNLKWNSNLYQFTVMMRFSNSCVNPILYGLKSKVFRTRFKEVFSCCGSSTSNKITNIRTQYQSQIHYWKQRHQEQFNGRQQTIPNDGDVSEKLSSNVI